MIHFYFQTNMPLPLTNSHSDAETNICFVNSSIQLLCSIPFIREFFQLEMYSISPQRSYKLCSEMKRLFCRKGSSSAAILRMLIGSKRGLFRFMDYSQQDAVDFLLNLINEIEKELGCYNVPAQYGHKINCFVSLIQGIELYQNKFMDTADGSCFYCGTLPTKMENTFNIFHLTNNNSKSESIQELLMENLQKPSEKFTLVCSSCKNGLPQDIHSFRSIVKGCFQ